MSNASDDDPATSETTEMNSGVPPATSETTETNSNTGTSTSIECEQKASTLPDSSQMNILLQPYTPELSVELSITNKPIQTSHDSTSDSKELKTNSSPTLPRITIIGTGGTIAGQAASDVNTVSYKAGVLDVDQLLKCVPSLGDIATIQAEQIASLDSKDMTFDLWITLAQRINTLLRSDDADGVVITHGTDTLEETGFFLNLILKSVKPVVLTAAMRPSTALSADGPLNLYEAVLVAGNRFSCGQGVLIVMNNEIHSPRYITKTNTTAVQTFKSFDDRLGLVSSSQVIFKHSVARRHTTQSQFCVAPLLCAPMPWVEIIMSYTEPSEWLIDKLVEAGVKGIVIAGTGNGTIHTKLQEAAVNAVKKGVAVVRTTRVFSGDVMHNGSVNDDQLGFLTTSFLNPWKARVLLMLILAHDIKEYHERQSIFNNY